MTIDPETRLLEQVRQASGLMYVSDLHEKRNYACIRAAIAGIPADCHAAETWRALANYVTDERFSEETGEEIRDALLAYLLPEG